MNASTTMAWLTCACWVCNGNAHYKMLRGKKNKLDRKLNLSSDYTFQITISYVGNIAIFQELFSLVVRLYSLDFSPCTFKILFMSMYCLCHQKKETFFQSQGPKAILKSVKLGKRMLLWPFFRDPILLLFWCFLLEHRPIFLTVCV